MRRIRFRGKDSEKWYYGDLRQCELNYMPYVGIIQNEDRRHGVDTNHIVNPETVGQFTGMQDKNGKDVYEGDILRVPETMLNAEIYGVVEYEDNGFIVRSVRSGCKTDLAWALRKRMEGEPMTEVVGNVTDNPELKKG